MDHLMRKEAEWERSSNSKEKHKSLRKEEFLENIESAALFIKFGSRLVPGLELAVDTVVEKVDMILITVLPAVCQERLTLGGI